MRVSIYEDGSYLRANPTWGEEDLAWKAAQVIKILNRNGLRPAQIADVGCGAGAILDQVSAAFDAMGAGYDIAPEAFSRSSRRARDRLRFHRQDILETNSCFDLVLALDVVEHIDDYIGFLRNLRKYGRHHVFHIPLDMNVQNVARSAPMAKFRRNLGHLHYFSKDTALATLEYAGYRVDDWFYTPLFSAFHRPDVLYNIAKLPRYVGMWISKDLSARFLGGVSLMVLCHDPVQKHRIDPLYAQPSRILNGSSITILLVIGP